MYDNNMTINQHLSRVLSQIFYVSLFSLAYFVKHFDGVIVLAPRSNLRCNSYKNYCKPEIYVELYVGHVTIYTWHWIYARYHEIVVGCNYLLNKFGCLYRLSLSMGEFFLCKCNRKYYINWG